VIVVLSVRIGTEGEGTVPSNFSVLHNEFGITSSLEEMVGDEGSFLCFSTTFLAKQISNPAMQKCTSCCREACREMSGKQGMPEVIGDVRAHAFFSEYT
jgi:hypothetical protein